LGKVFSGLDFLGFSWINRYELFGWELGTNTKIIIPGASNYGCQ
jgi:hypothetical protein